MEPTKSPLKVSGVVIDKFSLALSDMKKEENLLVWANLYFQLHVVGAPEKTMAAKNKDLARFLQFFAREVPFLSI